MRLAIVGGGVSGLVAARQLSRLHKVTLFESGERPGGHVNTVSVVRDDRSYRVDTGFIVFNPRNYPHFCALLDELGIESRETEMSFGVRHDAEGVEFCGNNLSSLFADRRLLFRTEHWGMLLQLRRFLREAESQVHAEPDLPLRRFVERFGYGVHLLERFLLPLAAALWSCPLGLVSDFPARFVVSFLANHEMLSLGGRTRWRTIKGGSQTYVDAMLARLEADVRCGRSVDAVRRTPQGVELEYGAQAQPFDEVIVACHADDALRLISSPTELESKALGAFHYQPNEATLHTDESVMPKSRLAWASWNYSVREGSDRATVTYDMNRLQGLGSATPLLVTLNGEQDIDPRKIIERVVYRHPVASFSAEEAKLRRSELIRYEGVSYCGAYWGYGFHEDGARSAHEVAAAFGGSS